MIRRGFWLTAGAVTGIWGYRRVAAAGRRVSASLTPGGTLEARGHPSRHPDRPAGEPAAARSRWPGRPTGSPVTCARAWSYIWLGIRRPQALPSQQTEPPTTTHNPRMATDGVGRDRPPLPCVLRAARAHHRAFGLPGCRRPHGALRHRGHAAVQAVPARPADAAVQAGRGRAEVRPHAGHRRGGQDHQARHVLPDAGQLVVRRLLQGRRDQVRLGAADQVRGGRRVRLPGEQAVGHRPARGRRGVRDLAERDRTAGRADPAPRPGRQLLAHGRARARRPVLGDLLRPRPRIRPRRRPEPRTRTGSSRSGTWSSCRTS